MSDSQQHLTSEDAVERCRKCGVAMPDGVLRCGICVECTNCHGNDKFAAHERDWNMALAHKGLGK